MSETTSHDDSGGVRGQLTGKIVPLLTLLFVIAITVGLYFFYHQYPGRFEGLKAYGYLGAFLLSLAFNATVILPVGNVLVISALGAVMPSATLVGLAGGAGAAIGEITGFMVGYSGRGIAEKSHLYHRVEGWIRRWGVVTIFIFSLLPFIFDLAAIAAGVLRFPFWKFLLLCWLGRTISYIVVAIIGAWSWVIVAAIAVFALVLAVINWSWKRNR